MPISLPNLTFTVTPPGGSATNYTSKLAYDGVTASMGITQNFGRQGDTATFVLVDSYNSTPNFTIPVFSQVKLVDNTAGQTLFAGVCNDPVFAPISPNFNEWQLGCTDYTFYADNAIVHGTFIGETVDQIVVQLTQQANCGITAKTIRNGGYVAPGPTLASFVMNYGTLSDAWRKLSQLAGQTTPYGWYVDENRNLHFYDASTAISSGVTFTTTPTSGGLGSLTQAHYDWDSSCTYEWDGSSVRNQILVQGASQTITHGPVSSTAPTDTWLGNGSQTSWPLRYTVTGTPILHVNRVATSIEVVNAGAVGTFTWQVQQNQRGGWFLTNTSGAPSSGTKIQIWYDYQVPIVARANDRASQAQYTGPNGGVFTEYINDSSLSTVPMALARAQRERTEYAFAAERINFTTTEDWLGWIRSGQTCTIVNRYIPDSQNGYNPGINDTFIITGNSVSFSNGGYRKMALTGIRI